MSKKGEKIGGAIKQKTPSQKACARKKRRAQMEAILSVEEPMFADADESLEETFNISSSTPGINVCDFTFAIICYRHNDDENLSLVRFMPKVQHCFNDKTTKWYGTTKLWQHEPSNKEDAELAERVKEHILELKGIIEERLTQDYYWNGQQNKLEILKRRFYKNWSDRVSHDVKADVDANIDEKIDGNITINFLTKE